MNDLPGRWRSEGRPGLGEERIVVGGHGQNRHVKGLLRGAAECYVFVGRSEYDFGKHDGRLALRRVQAGALYQGGQHRGADVRRKIRA